MKSIKNYTVQAQNCHEFPLDHGTLLHKAMEHILKKEYQGLFDNTLRETKGTVESTQGDLDTVYSVASLYANFAEDPKKAEAFLLKCFESVYPDHFDINWKCTDPDSKQYLLEVSPKVFKFQEWRLVNPDTEECAFYSTEIDLNDYEIEEMWEAVRTFGYPKDTFNQWMQDGSQNALIAECIFELDEDQDYNEPYLKF